MDKKTKKTGKKMNRKAVIAILSAMIALLLAASAVVTVLTTTMFDNVLTQFFGYSQPSKKGDTDGADTQYVKSDYATASELYAYEEELCARIAREGAALLKNDGLLPLSAGTQLDLYSVSSVNLVSGGSGSGSGSFELTADLKTGLEAAGFKVNETLWSFYKTGAGSSYTRGVGVVNYGRGFDWDLNECPLSVLQADAAVMGSIDQKNVAMFVISRTGGEGGDEPRDMAAFGGNAGEHYLEPDDREKEILRFLGETYDSVIVLLNVNNAFELGFIKEADTYKNLKAVVNFPGAGRTGTYGLGQLLLGVDSEGNEISPSGHLVDTLVYDNFSSPAMQNFGDAAFTDAEGNLILSWAGQVTAGSGQYGSGNTDTNEDAGRCPYYFVTYNEGIYVGYKYYETRYEDAVLDAANVGSYSYKETVTFPFGFGSSYTTFRFDGFKAAPADGDGNITVTVNVTNTGSRAGRDVVELYYQAPYTDYDRANHVEKAAVNLCGFEKTGLLKPGDTETVTLTVNMNDFRSYDDSGEGSYLLEAGDYYITAAEDAHMAVNNILKAKCAGDEAVLSRIVETAEVTGMAAMESTADLTAKFTPASDVRYEGASNLFADATLIDRSAYLSRSNWSAMENDGLRYAVDRAEVTCPGVGKNPWGNTHIAACAERDGLQYRAVIPEGLLEKLLSADALRPEAEKADSSVKPALNEKNGLELIDLRGASYDDARWELLLNQLNVEELSKLVAQCGYCSPEMKSVSKPLVYDLDGPAGLNKVVGHGSWPIGDGLVAMTWATEYMIACTWDADLAEDVGEAVGEDGLHGDVVGWYGPAMNIHRTPFSGRNFEYYSEDPYISGIMGKSEVQGAARKGLYGFVKHFALNDQETHRDQNGLITFSNEQAIRELYLRPFELTIKDNSVTVSYNEAITDADGKITGYELKTAEVPATTAVMSSFNRIGATWAGGNYNLITGVLRKEFGFKGFVLTDYDTGDYMVNHAAQMLEAGGDAKLNTIGEWNGLKSGENANAYIAYAKAAAKNVLYTVVNSAAMNGYVHGVHYVAGHAYYKTYVYIFDGVCLAGAAVLVFFLVRAIRKKETV